MFVPLMFLILSVGGEVSAKCVMYGECTVVNGFVKSCSVDHEALPILASLSEQDRNDTIEWLSLVCPHYLYDEDGNQKPDSEVLTCCDHKQIQNIHDNLLIAQGVLGRCPICLRNFARQICEMNCAPDQSRFVNVTQELDETTNKAYVNEIDYKVYEDFMINAHTSCAGVIMPQLGIPAINLMCGNAPVCDADAWFGFVGDTSINTLAPVQVNFLRWPTPEDSMNVTAPLCHETVEGDVPCSCVDCFVNCPMSEIVVEDICKVLSVNCVGFSVGIVFFVISVIIFIVLTLLQYRKMKRNEFDKSYSYNVNFLINIFQKVFQKCGEFSASNPVLAIMITTWIAFAMLFGVVNVNLTANPLELWSAPESRSRQELNYFNSRFGPFYRASQVFLTFKGLKPFEINNVTFGPALRIEAVQELVRLENAILDIGREDNTVTLEEVCYAPLRTVGSAPNLNLCVSMSVSTYLPDKNNINNNTYLNNIQNCLNNYLSIPCMATWGGGADSEITVGGYEGDNVLEADTLLINFPISNSLEQEYLEAVLEWEQKFLDLMYDYEHNWKKDFVDVAYGTERAIEDEIQRVSEAEIVPIAISYLLMFIYVILALGNIRSFKTILIDCKVTVAISCIIVVLIAMFCAIGLLGYLNITISLLAINVIPFFVLSVGIDNVFLMLNELSSVESNLKIYEDYKENFSFEKKKRFVFGKVMSSIGPSMFVSSVTQITCFAIGSISGQPAVKSFAIFATFALIFLFVFQITTVVAILAIDYKRSSQNRFDILCCVQKKILNDEEPLQDYKYQSVTQRFMKPYANFILGWRVKIFVAIIFMFLVSMSVILIPQIEIGLDQEMSLPTDSFVYKYLQAVNQILRLGPPVYFVLKGGLNISDFEHQNAVCGGQLCNADSLTTQIYLASRNPEVTYIARSSNSWLDDFIDWSSSPGTCCKYNSTSGGYCSSTDNSPECSYCSIDRSPYGQGLRPANEAFEDYIPTFLRDTPTDACSKGGLASYFSNVIYVLDSEGKATVHDSNFMAYHTTLATSKDYITAVKYGYEISENITKAIQERTGVDVEVFPYSVFYVYYEQYLNIWGEVFASIGFCLLGALFINLLVTGFNFMITITLIFTVIMIVIQMMGVMYLWNIPLNAVSSINLIVSIGIGVEFCSHMAYAYATSNRPPNEKVRDAIEKVGSTIITGITFTNIPIIVLAFSYTEIIEVFFFRMLISLVVLGFLHGMIFFPVLLSFVNDLRYR